jgi:hypothetical protein
VVTALMLDMPKDRDDDGMLSLPAKRKATGKVNA